MEEPIKNAAQIEENSIDNQLEKGNEFFENALLGDLEMFSKAWESYSSIYNNKSASKLQKSGAGYRMYEIMRECDDDNELIDFLKNKDIELKRQQKIKNITNRYVRFYIGRKYLADVANRYDNEKALVEYGLNCIGLGDEKSFAYRGKTHKGDNELTALEWAKKRMLLSKNNYIRMIGYIIYSAYYFIKCDELGYRVDDVNDFCVNILEAKDISDGQYNQYLNFYLAHLYADSNFKSYKSGEYFDVKKGKELFEELSISATDPRIKKSSEKKFKILNNL